MVSLWLSSSIDHGVMSFEDPMMIECKILWCYSIKSLQSYSIKSICIGVGSFI